MKSHATEIVLTGGPCGGKTRGLNYLHKRLTGLGIRVFTVPEFATQLIRYGISDMEKIEKEDIKKYIEIERQILARQIEDRWRYNCIAKLFGDEKCVILYDRGPMDIDCYVPCGEFEKLIKTWGYSVSNLCDSYNAVIHMVTAANGAEEHYTKANNSARRETPEQARAVDQRTLEAWIGHPHLRIIDNSTGFDAKLGRLYKAVCREIGVPVPVEIERKFLVRPVKNIEKILPPSTRKIYIEQAYLLSPKYNHMRIRKRTHRESSTYYKTRKRTISGAFSGKREEVEEKIDEQTYLNMMYYKNPKTSVVKKTRYCFIHKHQYFELDAFLEPTDAKGLLILEIELMEENEPVLLPDFLKIEKEVTGVKKYTNYEISKRE